MNKLHGYTSTPTVSCRYTKEEVIDGITILFNEINGIKQGPAKALYPTHTVKYMYVNDLKEGNAVICHLDKTRILFTYVNDLADGPATVIYPNGERDSFKFKLGLSTLVI